MDAAARWKKANRYTHTILLRAPEEAVLQAIMARGESATGACRVALLGYEEAQTLRAELAASRAEVDALRAELAAAQAEVDALRAQAVRPWWRRIFQK